MSIALDASTPARWSGTTVGQASASFIAPADALLVCCIEFDASAANSSRQTIADSGGLTWTHQVERLGTETTTGGYAAVVTARTTSIASRTITATQVGASGTNRISVVCYVFTGVDLDGAPVDAVTASNEGGSTTDNINTTSVTPTGNGVLVACAAEWNALGACTSVDLKGIDGITGTSHGEYAGALDVIDGWKECSAGVGVTGNLNSGGASPQWKWVQIVVLELPPPADALGTRDEFAITQRQG